MADARVIARQVGVSEKDMMLQSLSELKSDVKQLLRSRNDLGLKKNDEFGEILEEAFKRNNTKKYDIEDIVEDIVEKYAKEQSKRQDELIARMDANVAIFKKKMESPGKYAASSAFEGASNLIKDTRTNVDYNAKANESIRNGLSSTFKTLQTLFAPKLTVEKSKDIGQNSPDFNSATIEKSYDSVAAKIVSSKKLSSKGQVNGLLKALEAYHDVTDKEKEDFINGVVKSLSGDDLKKGKGGRRKKNKEETVEELTERLEQDQYKKENKEKEALIASLDAKTAIRKKKYFTDVGTTTESLTSDAFGTASTLINDTSKNVDYNASARNKIGNFLSDKFKKASILARPWHEAPPKKDVGQNPPNNTDEDVNDIVDDVDNDSVEKSNLESIRFDVSDIRSKVNDEAQEDESEDSLFDGIYDELKGDSRKSSKISENVSDIEDSIYSLDSYVRHRLVDDIVKELNREVKGSKQNNEMQESENEDQSEQEGDEGDEGEEGGGNKWMRRLKKGGQWLKKGGSWLKNAGMRGGGMAMNGLRMLGSGSAMGGAAVVALGAASAYTFYETAKTAMAISEGKEQVRDSTKGSAEASIAKNQEKTTKDSPDVKAGANRYEKAGLSKDESLSTSLAERQNSKMLTSAASMSGIFGAARHSTDFRSSEEEVNTLLEGETLADTIRSALQGLQGRLQDPESVKNMSPGEIRSVHNQAKVTIKQIGDLKKTWEDAKKKGSGFLDSQWLKDESLVGNGDALINSLVDSGKDIESSFNDWEKDMESGAKSRTEKKADKKSDKKPDDKKPDDNVTPDKASESVENPDKKKLSKLNGFDSEKRREERKARYERLKAEGKITGDPDIDSNVMIMEERQEQMMKEAGQKPATGAKVDEPEDEFNSRIKALEKAKETGVMEPPKGYRELTQEEKDAKYKRQQELRDKIGQVEGGTQPHTAKMGEELKSAMTDNNVILAGKLDAIISKIDKMAPAQQTAPPPQSYDLPYDGGFATISNISKGA